MLVVVLKVSYGKTYFSDFSSSLLGPKMPIRLLASASVSPPSSHWRRVRTSSMTMCSISTLSLSYKSAAVNWIWISALNHTPTGLYVQCSCRPWRVGPGLSHRAPYPCTLASFGPRARQLEVRMVLDMQVKGLTDRGIASDLLVGHGDRGLPVMSAYCMRPM